MITKEEVLKKIKELEFPTINELSKQLNSNRNYVSVLLNSLQAENKVTVSIVGNNKIWGLRK
jgi:DNA-binding IclR family transcriptional regulator